MTFSRLSGALLAAAALLALVLPATASADARDSTLWLSIKNGERAAASVRLECEPPGGTHPDAKTACAELTAAGGDLTMLQEQLVACTLEFRPVRAEAFGEWAGERVWWRQDFGNLCALRAATGTVFAF